MKICRLHSVYREDSGENVSFRQENDLLRAHGHEVIELARRADQAGAVTMACEALGLSLEPAEAIEEMLRQRPNVIDIEALFPRWGPRALAVLGRSGVPIVQRVRNFRHWCVAGTAFRSGAPCTDCMDKRFAGPGVVHGCYRGSRSQSAVAAASLWLTDWSAIDHFIAVSKFAKNRLIDNGVAWPDQISVKPNCVADPGVGDGSGGYALFVGEPNMRRPEKGAMLLAEAYPISNLPGSKLKLAHGMTHAEVLALMKRAAFVVVPSVWHEPFGRIVIEAYSCGTPVLATRMGGLPEIVEDGTTGWLVEPNPEALAYGLKTAFEQASKLRYAARGTYLMKYTPEINHSHLMAAYARAMAARMCDREAVEVAA